MIDYEVQIFDRVYQYVAPLCAKNKFVSEYVASPSAFPAGSLVELSNVTVRSRQSSSITENYARVMYQFDSYATSKQKCKEVFAAGDEAMIGMGFTRISGNWMDNADNTKVHRYTARYEAEIDPNGVIYRRP